MSSASNFILVYAASRVGSLSEIGALSIAILIFGLGTAAHRGAVFRSVLVTQSQTLLRSSMAAAMLIGLATSMVELVAYLLIGATRHEFLVLALLCPVLYVQDAARQGLLVQERYVRVLLADVFWLLLFVTALVVSTPSEPYVLVAAWAVAGVLSLPIALPDRGIWREPVFRSGLRRLAEVKIELLEMAVLRGVPFVATILLAAVVLFDDYGAWSGLRAYFGPLTVLYATLSTGGLVLMARLALRSPAASIFASAGLLVLFPLIALALGGGLKLFVLGSSIGPASDVASAYQAYIWPVALFVGLAGSIQVARSHSHAWKLDPETSLLTQARASVASAIGLLVGAPWGMDVAAWTSVAGTVVGLAVWLRTAFKQGRITVSAAPPSSEHL